MITQIIARRPCTDNVISRGRRKIHHHLFPVSITYAGITDDVKQRLMESELLNLTAQSVSDVARSWLVREDFGQFVHRAEHVSHLLLNRLGVQLLKRT